ncbi:MAG: sigma-70 family RNA polymerase sigma factor [Kiritimatiellae bacterium]|nr:sigma-70 family RNA polymerase sigma factor [Kiritimatiellia bacterium]
MPRTLTDREREHLRRLVTEHQARIRAFLCGFVVDPDVVDEITQDVFLGVVSRCGELAARTEQDAGRYLCGVARNLVRMRWRKDKQKKVRWTGLVDYLVHQRMSRELDREPGHAEDRVHALRECLRGLTDRARMLVERHFFQDVPLSRLAEETQRPASTLRVTMLRIRRELKTCIEGRLKEAEA